MLIAHTELGQINGAGDKKALFKTMITGEVIKAFDETRVARPFARERVIPHGKSASFLVYGVAGAKYLPRGSKIEGSNNMLHSEVTINIDDMLISDVKILDIDEAMMYEDVRGEYGTQLGRALANAEDKNLIQLMCLAGRATASQNDIKGGTQLSAADADTNGQTLADLIFNARQTLVEKSVPYAKGEWAFITTPAMYSLLAMTKDIINKDWGGAGVYADGTVLRIAGFDIIESNHVPSTNITQTTGTNNTYHGDFTKTLGVCVSKGAVGTVRLKDLELEMTAPKGDYAIENQATLMVAKYLQGHGILEPRRAVEILKV